MDEAIDPVCKMTVEVSSAKWSSEFEGQTFYFCAPGCQKAFDANPQSFLAV